VYDDLVNVHKGEHDDEEHDDEEEDDDEHLVEEDDEHCLHEVDDEHCLHVEDDEHCLHVDDEVDEDEDEHLDLVNVLKSSPQLQESVHPELGLELLHDTSILQIRFFVNLL